MAAAITPQQPVPNPGAPMSLFRTPIYGGGIDQTQGRQYDVGSDGRFLINTVVDDTTSAPITLILNWHPAE